MVFSDLSFDKRDRDYQRSGGRDNIINFDERDRGFHRRDERDERDERAEREHGTQEGSVPYLES